METGALGGRQPGVWAARAAVSCAGVTAGLSVVSGMAVVPLRCQVRLQGCFTWGSGDGRRRFGPGDGVSEP